ncbi:MAG: hypothetical protein WD426_11105 [Anditalea sp.]
MKNEIIHINKIWESMVKEKRDPTLLPHIDINEIVSEILAVGPFYYYIIDFYDFSIPQISKGFKEAHGLDPNQIETVKSFH